MRAQGDRTDAARLIAAGAATLSLSVLADSAMEHYRGGFHNPAMTLPLVASALTLGIDASGAGRAGSRNLGHSGAMMIGLTGLGFHAYNILKRPHGLSFNNLFYGAPAGAPAALVLAGALGGAADRVDQVPARMVAGLVALGIAGSVGEAGLLHFRGAFQNPAMWLPVTIPPLGALSLAFDSATGMARGHTVALLGATALVGMAGAAFHAYGVSRAMGGWRNWRQNLLAGPPLPAPPTFAGLAIAGLGAWLLMRRARG